MVTNARRFAVSEEACPEIVLPAAWLHDCGAVPKESPLRPTASVFAARAAGEFLRDSSYPAQLISYVGHAIEAHSFSVRIMPETPEVSVVQDADRLDALGVIGIAWCTMLGVAMGRTLYEPDEPFSKTRTLTTRPMYWTTSTSSFSSSPIRWLR